MKEDSDINTNTKQDKIVDKNKVKEISKLMNEIINTTKPYKNKNIDELKEAVIKQIKDSKISPDLLINQDKDTLLHLAIRLDKYERVFIIVESYISLLGITDNFFDWFLSENNSNETSLDLCVQFGNREIIKYMYLNISRTTEAKFRITEERKGIFHYAALFDQTYPIIFFHEKLQKYFKKTTIIDVPSELGITPLHCACIRGSKNAVDLLLDLGANINAEDKEGNNCLHYAVNSNNPNLLKKLIIRGADKTKKNYKGETPLDLAVQNNYQKIVNILAAKNRLFSNPCSNEHEIVGLRSSHNNITLFVAILFMGLGKWIYLSRINYVKEGNLKLDVVPFIYEIEHLKELCLYGNYGNFENCIVNQSIIAAYTLNMSARRNNLSEVSQLFEPDTFGYNNMENIYIIGWLISTFDAAILFLILKFMCFSGGIFEKKKTIKKNNSLISLFEQNKNICVKCRIKKDETTVHCIVCNGCVRKFDHHCSWLNICISENNLKWFRGFLYIFIAYIVFNVLFFAYSKYINLILINYFFLCRFLFICFLFE